MPTTVDVKARLRAQIAAIEGTSSDHEMFGLLRSDDALGTACGGLGGADARTTLDALADTGDGVDAASSAIYATSESVADEAERAFRKIERLARVREQASTALRHRLVREGFGADAVEAALNRALACGLVDDARYAEVLVRSRLSQGRGAQGIEAELAGLDICISSVCGWPDEFGINHENEVNRALGVLERKPPRAKNRRDAAYRRLAQKGFGASVASTAARLWSEANSA